jgi:penicillin-binding protein 1C
VLALVAVAMGALLGIPAALVLSVLVAAAMTPLPTELSEGPAPGSWLVTDRDGKLLREVRAEDGTRARWVSLDECGELAQAGVVAVEDRRFYFHRGVDIRALVRALDADLRARRIVSGGSTLTMQLARVVRPHAHSLLGKLGEIVLALRIEASLSKRQILEQYLNRVSFGPNLRGIAAASHAYFDTPPKRLSGAQVALLVGLLRGPSYYDLARHVDRAVRRRNRVLAQWREAGVLDRDAYEAALGEPALTTHGSAAFGAPHLVQGIVHGSLVDLQPGLADALKGPIALIETTLDGSLQAVVEAASARIPIDLAEKHVTAASVIVVDNASGDVLAYVGSPDVFNVENGGRNDGVRALRQPGSTLKPFLYALAFERLGWTGATVLPDIELRVATPAGEYAPRNYDDRFRGPVRLREALGNSLNVPAVWTTTQLGVAPLLEWLRALGFASLSKAPDDYGPALALGDGEVTLLELVQAYALLARDGVFRPLRLVRRVKDGSGQSKDLAPGPGETRVAADIAAQITDILRDRDARRASFGERTVLDFEFDVAAKTGTSKGARDNWALGYTRQVTVGVWVGNFDGSPMRGTSGITGAGPLFHSVMDAAMRNRPREPLALAARATQGEVESLERVEVCALSGEAPGRACRHRVQEWMPRGGRAALSACSFHEHVRIDRRNGLRAGPSCAAEEVMEEDVERYPAEYAAWASRAGRPTATAADSPFCPPSEGRYGQNERSPSDGAVVRIANVEDWARFAIDPDRPRALQILEVRILAPPSAPSVRLRIDGAVVGVEPPPFRFEWPLVEGEHVLVADAEGLPPSDPVHVRVRGP